jgi:hypothetical protein
VSARRSGWRPALRIGGAIVLAAVAVFAALLAADLRAWPLALDRGDAAYAVSPGHAAWTPSTHVGGLSGSLLGTGDDVAFRHALVLYRQVVGQQELLSNALGVEALRAQAERALAGPADSGNPSLASQARTLLGVLAFGAAANGGAGASQTDAAISAFTDAVTVDPSNTAAKYDLELLLRLTAAGGLRSNTGPTNGFGRTGTRGAAGGVPGGGY